MTGPLPDVLLPITTPMSWGYRQVISIRNARFDRGFGVGKVNVPVISIGNLTTGGAGKTPTAMWLAELLLQHGARPAVAMRGYGAIGDQPADEAIEYQDRLPAVPVIVHPDRLTASREFLEEHPEIDSLLLDDGFQHRRLHRDLDIVLVDASRQTFRDRLLPAGHLREPVSGLARADAVIVTRAATGDESLAKKIERYHGKPPLAWSRHVWRSVVWHEPGVETSRRPNIQTSKGDGDTGAVVEREPGSLAGKRIATLLGVGNPQSVLDHLEHLGARVVTNIPAADHERFTRAKIAVARQASDGVDALVMTRKDWVKARDLIDLTNWPAPVVVPELSIDVHTGRDALAQKVLDTVAAGSEDASSV